MLERDGVISRYVAVLDQRAVGLPVSVFVSIKLEKQREESLDRFAKAIARWPEVLECYLMTGSRDYWLRVVVPDLDAYERFVKQKLTRARGHRLDRIELRAGAGEVHQRAAGLSVRFIPVRWRRSRRRRMHGIRALGRHFEARTLAKFTRLA